MTTLLQIAPKTGDIHETLRKIDIRLKRQNRWLALQAVLLLALNYFLWRI